MASRESEQEQEQKLREMYGRLPTRADILKNQLKQRRFFDSGDYAMSKAGKKTEEVGSEHPDPQQIPHRGQLLPTNVGTSPVRRSSTLAPKPDRNSDIIEDEK